MTAAFKKLRYSCGIVLKLRVKAEETSGKSRTKDKRKKRTITIFSTEGTHNPTRYLGDTPVRVAVTSGEKTDDLVRWRDHGRNIMKCGA